MWPSTLREQLSPCRFVVLALAKASRRKMTPDEVLALDRSVLTITAVRTGGEGALGVLVASCTWLVQEGKAKCGLNRGLN